MDEVCVEGAVVSAWRAHADERQVGAANRRLRIGGRREPSKHHHFGNEFLVAPIVALNANSRQVYLPAGNWVDFWTSAVHSGGQTITWNSGNRMQFPLFVREGAIVPLLPENVQTLCDPNYVNNAAIAAAKQDLYPIERPSSVNGKIATD